MAHPFWEQVPWLDQVVSLANSSTWGVAIMGKFIFPHSTAPLSFLRALPAIKSCLGGCLSMEKASLSYFLFQVPIPATYNPSLMYPLYVCTYL